MKAGLKADRERVEAQRLKLSENTAGDFQLCVQ